VSVALILALALAQQSERLEWAIPKERPKDGFDVFGVFNGKFQVRGYSREAYSKGPIPLLKLKSPKLPPGRFVLKSSANGRMSEGQARLEMTVVMGDGVRLIVQTRDTGGPMAPLIEKLQNRRIELPFVYDTAQPPKEIEVGLVFDGEGDISLVPFTLEPWPRWSLTWLAAGGFAAMLGVALGCLGGVYGLLAAIPSSRRGALTFGKIMAALGVAMIVAAPCLYAASLPFGIWLPVGVAGLVALVAFGGTLLMVRKGIESADRMNANADPGLEPS
jgi:hypothetical protein